MEKIPLFFPTWGRWLAAKPRISVLRHLPGLAA